jgi:stage IV sporulation protein FB
MLRWRLFGIQFCIEPSFWFMNALWALLIGRGITGQPLNDRLLLIFILVWILCTLVSVMVHELGHVIVGRLFGQPGNITLSGMGGQAVGTYDELRPWQRILVIMAGPGAGFLFVAFIVAMDGSAWNQFMDYLTQVSNSPFWGSLRVETFWIDHTGFGAQRRQPFSTYSIVVIILTFMNLFVNIMNLLPIIPMDGGMIFKEICCLIMGRQGLKVAFGVSFFLACAMTLFYLELTLEQYGVVAKRIQHYYPFGFPEFSLVVFASLAFQSWRAYQRLAMAERYLAYMQDDMSEPRHPSGVREIPVKDPRDFAPPAPGSERPRY